MPEEASAKLRSRIIVTLVLIAPIILGIVLWNMMPKGGGPRGMGTAPPPNIPERSGKGGEGVMGKRSGTADTGSTGTPGAGP